MADCVITEYLVQRLGCTWCVTNEYFLLEPHASEIYNIDLELKILSYHASIPAIIGCSCIFGSVLEDKWSNAISSPKSSPRGDLNTIDSFSVEHTWLFLPSNVTVLFAYKTITIEMDPVVEDDFIEKLIDRLLSLPNWQAFFAAHRRRSWIFQVSCILYALWCESLRIRRIMVPKMSQFWADTRNKYSRTWP